MEKVEARHCRAQRGSPHRAKQVFHTMPLYVATPHNGKRIFKRPWLKRRFMPQTRSKTAIIKRLQTERKRLEDAIALLDSADLSRAGAGGKSSVKDVLAHLADWEARMPVWINAARSGDPVESPEPGLTWQQLGILNQRIYKAHRHQSMKQVQAYFRAAHDDFMRMVETMPEDEMLNAGRYTFIPNGAVYDWLKGYANHDLWGKRKIREWMRARSKRKKKSRK